MTKPLDRTGTWRTYSIADGLPSVHIQHVAEDSEGYLWFATWDNGASRFDGDAFETFTQQNGLCSDQIITIYMDSQKRLWFGTSKGICWYDGANFHHLEDNGITGRTVQSIYEDREGRIWCGGKHTLGYYNGTAFHDIIPLMPEWSIPHCWGITQDPQGHLWFGTEYPIRFDGASFHRYAEEVGFSQAHISYAVSQDHTGKVWIGRLGKGDRLWCYADGTFQSIQVDLSGWLRKIQCDREGRMWFCTLNEVLYQDGDGFSRFTPADGLPHLNVIAVFQDREHQYWFATWGGIGFYEEHSISIFDLGKMFGDQSIEISQIVQDRRGDIWIGYVSPVLNPLDTGIARIDDGHVTVSGIEHGFDIDNCFSMYEDHEGYLWFGGGNGLFRYDGQTVEKMKPPAGLSISTIAQDHEGKFLFGYWEWGSIEKREELFASPLKLIYQQNERFQTIFSEKKKENILDRIGTVIVGRNGEIYFHLACHHFSNDGKGLARWHPEGGLKFYGVEDGLINDKINDLLLDRAGNLWIATQGGLACFDGRVFHNFTTADGLPNNRIRCLFEDRKGHLWFGTEGSVAHYDGQLFQTIKSPHIGLVCKILEDRDGNFWFGTTMGSIIRYRQRQTPPQIRLLQVIADKVYENPEEGIVSKTDQNVIFEYKGMSFSTHPRDILYIYRLKGYDRDWQPATRKMRAFYRDLPPGDYTFQVRAADHDLNYSEIAQARLSVEPDPRIEAFTDVINRREKPEVYRS